MVITSKDNDKVKYIQKLIKSGQKRKEDGRYIVEGIRMFREIPEADIIEAYYTEEALKKYKELEALLKRLDKQGRAFMISDTVYKKITDTGSPQGILGVVRMRQSTEAVLADDKNGKKPLILVLEHLQDPGNMGTIIRMGEGAGVTGILVSSDSVDIYNPKVVRSTMGSIFRMNICISSDLKDSIDKLKKKGVTVYGMHLDGAEFYNKDFTGASAFLIGNEGNGLSDEISSTADELLRIPMEGEVESLNAAISATVLSYEAMRQRSLS